LLFIFFTSPTTTFAPSRAAIHGGAIPAPTAVELIDAQKAKTKNKKDEKEAK